jgi:hypothetical protein
MIASRHRISASAFKRRLSCSTALSETKLQENEPARIMIKQGQLYAHPLEKLTGGASALSSIVSDFQLESVSSLGAMSWESEQRRLWRCAVHFLLLKASESQVQLSLSLKLALTNAVKDAEAVNAAT